MARVGRPSIDPQVKAERQKECRRLWRLKNRDQFNDYKRKWANKRYKEDEEYRIKAKESSASRYAYKSEAAAFAKILL